PELDVRTPGEHNGTFRGNNPAFVTATVALRHYWSNDAFEKGHNAQIIDTLQDAMMKTTNEVDGTTGEEPDLPTGMYFEDREIAPKVAAVGFENGILVETSGPQDEVLKLMPAMTIELDVLQRGLHILAECVSEVTKQDISLVLPEPANA